MMMATRWLTLLLAPLLLTSCLLVPAKFTASLDIRPDRTFTFAYVGEVQLMKSNKPEPTGEPDGTSEPAPDGAKRDEARMLKIGQSAAPAAGAEAGDTDEDAAQLKRLAEALRAEYGYRSATYIGNRRLAIDYRISGRLEHGFSFPFNPDAEIPVPFIAIELRGKDRVRIKAPGFSNGESGSGPAGAMGAMAGAPGSDGPGSALDGTFTLTTSAEIISQNQEDGAETLPDGAKRLSWRVTPATRDAPMAVLRVNALP
jgi:hypothetical protein